jgi:RimJ/RimL family protein N-acetyltransferase
MPEKTRVTRGLAAVRARGRERAAREGSVAVGSSPDDKAGPREEAAVALDLPEFVDDELRLRPPRLDDVLDITRICRDPDIERFTRVPSPYTEANARHFVELAGTALADGSGAHLLAVERGDDRILGAVGLSIDVRDWSGELGYWVAPEARGRHVATRASRLLLRFGFDELALGYVMLWAAAANAGSNGVARALGFTHEGTSRQAMLDGPTGERSAPRGDANLWGLRPGELT